MPNPGGGFCLFGTVAYIIQGLAYRDMLNPGSKGLCLFGTVAYISIDSGLQTIMVLT